MPMSFEKHASLSLPFPIQANRQNHFLRRLLPRLQSIPWLSAIWLGGSGGRGGADRWSSVDLHCLISDEPAESLISARMEALLDESFPDGWTRFGLESSSHTASLEGITHAHLPNAADQGGVYFRLHWTSPSWLPVHRAAHGPVHLLWSRSNLSDTEKTVLTAPARPLQEVDTERVQAGLTEFWRLLAHLPPAINREDHLAAANLLQRVRMVLTDLVVALNGATRPDTPARINSFLGPAQQDAFEKTLRQGDTPAESWIGQAVALIVLYRWYAPQLVEIHNLAYPTQLEETVLALLSTEVSGWPARITTA